MKKAFYLGTTLISILIVSIIVYAYGGTNPQVHGHDAGEANLDPLYLSGSNVGIGTTTPTNRLHLYGIGQTLSIEQNPLQAGNSIINLTTAGPDNYAALILNYDVAMYRRTNGGSYLYIGNTTDLTDSKFVINTNNGNVGIGTNNPTSTLQVEGNQVYFNINSIYPALHVRQAGIGPVAVFGDTGGNVGIGTATPNHKLHVIGNANVSGTMYLGYRQVANQCSSASYCSAVCPSGYKAVGGSCVSASYQTAFGGMGTLGDGSWGGNYDDRWACKTQNSATTTIQATAICLRVG